MATSLLVPAAQYLRMSTEHQQYSLETNPPQYGSMPSPTVLRLFARIRTLREAVLF